MSKVRIGNYKIGGGAPCLVIAEAGVNHNGEKELAHRLVDAAADAGANAVKFQTFRAERLVMPDAPKAIYQAEATRADESQLAMLARLELSNEVHYELMEHCRARDILFLSSPFDEESAEFLVELGVAAFKLGSGELTNLPFLSQVAGMGRPMIVSTGMAGLDEVEAAVRAIKAAGDPPLVLLQCVSNYPADPADTNLRAMETMARAFAIPVGYSDHTLGVEVALAATALGACIVEKHVTLDRTLPGPDQRASLEPNELAQLVRGIRVVESAMGNGVKIPARAEMDTARVARRSLVTATGLAAGTRLRADMLVARRPGAGLPPSMLDQVVGRQLRVDVPRGTVLSLEMLR